MLNKQGRVVILKILVTGANGYLGSGVVKTLLDYGNEVIATDFKDDKIDQRAKSYTCNLFQLDDPYSYFEKPDIVMHMAWRDGFVHNSFAHMEDLPKHFNFINKMVNSGIRKVCVMGTMHDIGFYDGSINENTPCNPMNLYGISKNALREAVKMLAISHNIDWQWLRGYYIVGNSQNGASIFSKITKAEKDGKTLFPFTSGQNQYDFVDYTDFCKYVATAISQNDINGIINISSGHPEKLADRVERFIKENNYRIKLDYGKYPDRAYDSKAVWGDDSKIKAIMKRKKK